ncbi:winged helix DNA-binding protein [Gluconacetobacter sp. Hr-1-5]|uniref:winged helix DNA-binding protein n=1 Tax=Gluconacetobacter sp. Hr-1-5 TaxID=3395370 RepID=UPI003B52CE3C
MSRKPTEKAPPQTAAAAPSAKNAYIVSSSHLAIHGAEDLSEFEFGLTVVNNAFQRWIVKAVAASGAPDLSPLDTLILHYVNHRSRRKSITDILFTLNMHERHYLNYAMKKLESAALISRTKEGKEVYLSVTEKGQQICHEYGRIRQICLLELVPETREIAGVPIGQLAKALRVLSGMYEQASRSAVSL